MYLKFNYYDVHYCTQHIMYGTKVPSVLFAYLCTHMYIQHVCVHVASFIHTYYIT